MLKPERTDGVNWMTSGRGDTSELKRLLFKMDA